MKVGLGPPAVHFFKAIDLSIFSLLRRVANAAVSFLRDGTYYEILTITKTSMYD